MESVLGDRSGQAAKELSVNQKSGKASETVPPERRVPAPYGTVSPAAERARRLAERMSAALTAAGFEVGRDFPCLRGDTTVSDEPFLTLGRLTPDVSEHLAEALSQSHGLKAA
jgi:hypothetical protein